MAPPQIPHRRTRPRARAVALMLLGVATVGTTTFFRSRPAHPAERGAPTSANVGNASCLSCHANKAERYISTAHALTSSMATAETIHGKFARGANTLRTANSDLYFRMQAEGGGFTQTAILRTSATQVMTRMERMDIVVGSGRKGQTYLYWDGDGLFQLPVSYWTELGAWTNSPGYVDGRADFERPIPRRCLECHASSFVSRAPPENAYARDSLRLGLSCEKCHGPGSEHVARARAAPPLRPLVEAAIVNPKKLPRDRQVDACALCHAGPGNPLTPPSSFQPGDVLARHLAFPPLDPAAPLDVHASQVQLLERSRCYRASATMSCSTCHDVHQVQRDLGAFAAQCMSCHKVERCGQFAKLGHQIDQRCVTCHMPLQQTNQIIIASGHERLQPKVRNHQIAIYPGVRLP
jgi:hypothetical protein